VKTNGKRACEVCGTALSENSEFCPVCALRGAISPQTESISATSSELCFEHYTVLKNEDGTPMELGRGGMGITYKAIDTHLRCPVALKIINTQFIGDAAAGLRFLREARAAASVHHPNVATVHHLGESGGNYFYAMEFVDGETLEALLHRRGRLEIDLALEIVTQVAAGLTAIHKQHLVHRDIKPSNIMISWEEGRLENVKIIDLGLAKGVTEDTLSIAGSFIGTPTYASPEQFAGLGTDIRSDLYSLGVTLWEILSGRPPFHGSAAELMDQHQRAALPTEKLRSVPAPVIALLQVLLAKDPNQRFQTPAQSQQAVARVREAFASGSGLTADELKSASEPTVARSPKGKRKKQPIPWLLGSGLCLAILLIAWFFASSHLGLFNQRATQAAPTEKSIAVLPFDDISPNKDDAYFADGVQDEILNNLAKIAQLKVISRTSVMKYRAGTERDLRQIASALGVANVLEGTVRRDGNHVRVSTELIDARKDNTIWADSYDRDLSDIFAIQSEISHTIADKLTAALSVEERRRIDNRPTSDLAAYDLYLKAKEFIDVSYIFKNPLPTGNSQERLLDVLSLLEHAVELDPKFALAYCTAAKANAWLYLAYDTTPARRSLGDEAVANALRLQPELPEAHLAYARQLYVCYRDYDRARVQLAIAKRGLPNDSEALELEAFMDRRQGDYEKAIEKLYAAIALDPRNPTTELANTLWMNRQFSAAERQFDRTIELAPDRPMLNVFKAFFVTFVMTGNSTALHSALAALPESMAEQRDVLTWRLTSALYDRDWQLATQLVEKMKGGDDDGGWFFIFRPVPVDCYLILIDRFRGGQSDVDANPHFAKAREQLNQKVQLSGEDAVQLSNLALIDAMLGKKEEPIIEAKHAAEMLPMSKDAMDGANVLYNLAVVYAWTSQLDLAFETMIPLTKAPSGIFYGDLKRCPFWDPLRKDPRFDKLLAELAPRD
jgi:serine/threonine protein kinase/Flp pilus assembly protein TadD